MQRNSSTEIRIWKQWTEERRTTRKTDSRRWKGKSKREDQHLFRIAIDDHTTSSRQLTARWSTATGVLMSASSIRRRLLHRELHVRVPLYRIPLTANHQRLHLQWAHERRAWQTAWLQDVFSDESRFNKSNHDDSIHVRRYADQRCLPECVIEWHSDRKPGVMIWNEIRIMDVPVSYKFRVISIATLCP